MESVALRYASYSKHGVAATSGEKAIEISATSRCQLIKEIPPFRNKYTCMAKNRMINTRFWVDDYISNLDPVEKLLFLYFLTSPASDISGAYEVPLKTVATDTGIEIQTVARIIKRFTRDKKIFYINGWVGIVNFAKHQLDNPKVQAGIKNGLDKAPKELVEKMTIDYTKTKHRLSHLNSNLNLNLNSNLNSNSNLVADDKSSAGIVQVLEIFKEHSPSLSYGNKTQRKAAEEMIAKYGLQELLGMCKVVIAVQGLPYAPRASTPYAMWQKIGDFKSYFEAEKNKSKNNVAEV